MGDGKDGLLIRRRGALVVVSAPSGAGKTTLCHEVRKLVPSLFYSVSCTTRAPRAGETNGVDFHFITEAEFVATRERVQAIVGETPVDEARLATEIATWAVKSDVAEELTRLSAHLEQFATLMREGGTVGRTLDFLIQEMNREVNTVGSKADDLELSQTVIAAKSTLEKLREQVQNLE